MNSISAIFTPSADGSIHLPIPPELRANARLRVVAWMEPDTGTAHKLGAGEWAKMTRGVAMPLHGESSDDARLAALKEKFELP